MNNHTATVLTAFVLLLEVTFLVAITKVPTVTPQERKGIIIQKHGFIRISDTAMSAPNPPDTYYTDDEPATQIPTPAVVVEEPSLKTKLGRIVSSNLKRVFEIAKHIGHPETMQAILLQESGGGMSHPVGNLQSPIGKRSYGLMQVQLIAARSILTRFPETVAQYFPGRTYSSLTDEEIIALLITNEEANIHIATLHFNLYLSLSRGNWDKAVAAYNMGIGNANKRSDHAEVPYVREIKSRLIRTVKPFNKSNSLALTTSI